ncbi:DNA repair protein RadC [Paraburkholderia sacchari]|uniref:RadC family protein n=1 Tax=Paraburkholderia sacchari TaxID=159450 RepID=UPI0039A5FEB4
MFEIACNKPLWRDSTASGAGGAPPALALDVVRTPPAALITGNEHTAAQRRAMPRERLRESGPAALSDLELVALVLGSGLRGHNVFDVARSLLAHFGSLRAMLDAQREEFEGLRGIGPAKASKLVAVLELARRALAEQLEDKPLIDSPGAVENYLRLLIGGRGYEVFVCLFLDVRHRLIRTEESTRGSLTRMAVYPREIVRRALMLNAASLIVAHNHPSGAVQPSASDRRLTRVLRETLALVEVQLVDHLIIGTQETFSFAQHGLD